MANNDDLDDFFKKKDRKGNKTKKATGVLANPKDLLKQLEIVTSATSAFKENPELEDDDEENVLADDVLPPVIPPAASASVQSSKSTSKSEQIPLTLAKDVSQEEWEEFEASSSKYEELRAKFSRANDQDEFDDDEDHLVDQDEISGNANEREQQKEKHVWKLDQVKANENNANPIEETVVRPVSPVKIVASTGSTYRPPHLRGNASSGAAVTIVSGIPSSGTSKKKQPNIASTEEFPTLGAAVNKK